MKATLCLVLAVAALLAAGCMSVPGAAPPGAGGVASR